MELAAPHQPPAAEQGNDSLEMIGGKSLAVAVLGLLDGVPVVRVSFIWCAEEDQSRTSRIPSLSFKKKFQALISLTSNAYTRKDGIKNL
jgi:hypothetical protein